MNRTAWWQKQYLNYVSKVTTAMPVISKLQLSLHTNDNNLILNDNGIAVDSFADELVATGYERKTINFASGCTSLSADVKWGTSATSWTNINYIAIIGSCYVNSLLHTKCLWYKQLDTAIDKPASNIIFISKLDVFIT
jgi:hypothetical protein